ncbi:MAG: universal stress protein [Burkholderiales bacterium]|nr:universal stress protein [Burkholderiales bacterium]
MFKHVLIPTDGSELSQAAAVKGLRFAKEIGARVTGLHVTPAFHVLTFDTVMIEETREEFLADSQAQGETRMARFKRSAAEEGVPFEAVIESSDHPYEAIVRVAMARECDLILMASHGRRGVQALLLGSETQKVLAHTRISVLVVR